MRLIYLSVSVLFCMIFVAGCGQSGPAKPAPDPVFKGSQIELKERFTGIAAGGELGSALAGVSEAIGKLPPEKSEPLLKDLNELQQAKTPQKIKEIAKRMADKL